MSQIVLLAIGAVFFVGAALMFFGVQNGKELVALPHATSTPSASSTSPMASTTKPIKPVTNPPVSTSTPTEQPPQAGNNGWKKAIATVFWAGEGATSDNGYIQNAESAWDEGWAAHFGGVDDPDKRCGSKPCTFTPKENPFYIALPYNDLDDNGDKKSDATRIPWSDPGAEKSVLKNRWVEVSVAGKSCFGQWQDVGPFYEDDIAYVFGAAPAPKNTYGEKAGIDLSPAMRDCLGVGDSSEVLWKHVEAKDVPAGPWKEVITTRLSQ